MLYTEDKDSEHSEQSDSGGLIKFNLDTPLMNINKLSGTSNFLAYLPYGQVDQKVKFKP